MSGKKPTMEEVQSSSEFPWSNTTLTPATSVLIALFAALVRFLVSLGPYSGRDTPPMYGDYEAQRHWMEITLHTPVVEWYRNTSANNLSYWGLDYPPLTAYQSLAHAFLLNSSIPESLALITSRGFESHGSKLLMRWTVLVSDFLLFFPAAVCFAVVYFRRFGGSGRERSAPWLLAMILLNPCLILIDHGHFQYNCISLGLTLGAIAAILLRHEFVASVLFSLAINHKQMSMYYAPAFFSYLLGKCLKRQNWVLEVGKLGIVVIGTFMFIWWPYLYSMEAAKEVLYRLAPFERGIYEDYVANFWCSTSVIIKWKKLFSIGFLKFLCICTTFFAFLPSCYQQIKAPSDRGFLYGLLNSSFAFYLFSYQVHEKSILMPLLPASLLAQQEPFLFGQLVYCGLLSMFPLLLRDNLILQYTVLFALFGLIFYQNGRHAWEKIPLRRRFLLVLPVVLSLLLHLIYLTLRPPKKYPFLYEALIMLFCFSQFMCFTIWTNIQQCSFLDIFHWTKAKKKDV
ncbi:probable dolichyl pyrophosphate Man9GlcNAc2 alpha-1,3-glucosyltransferase [Dendrobium catenatum]|uniref:Alpha-1,3-glucosyltransferase n=1 Tax=Dendrobium catenatum TaxID=906689 RepID=A0A2I0WKA9_9ASPA|nr:probable dolichyl pyrophosphate Man9GlcNAc2 alpha-1,3-glucosyltransferase [Dendrobium catenatum]PKU76092.1 putative dolichyl pyrophosphate Man9GlcNAc2 alpha-1,3-glucosyltransferase [Dendrobium catenatum]